jgi:hypothetical protein
MGFPITSSWIDDGEVGLDRAEAWPGYLAEAASATHLIVYLYGGDLYPGDELKGGVLEIGAALAVGAKVIFAGSGAMPEAMRTVLQHPNVFQVELIMDALAIINAGKTLEDTAERAAPPPQCFAFPPEETPETVNVIFPPPELSKDCHYCQTGYPLTLVVNEAGEVVRTHSASGHDGMLRCETQVKTETPESVAEAAPEPVACTEPLPPDVAATWTKPDPHAKERVTKMLSYRDVPAGTVMRMAIEDIPNRGSSDRPSKEDMKYPTSDPLFGEIGTGTARTRAVPQSIATYQGAYADHAASKTAAESSVLYPAWAQGDMDGEEQPGHVVISGARSVEDYERTYGSDPEIRAALRREDVLVEYGDVSEEEREAMLRQLEAAEALGNGELFITSLFGGHSGAVVTRRGGVASLRTSDPNFNNRQAASTAPLQPFEED